MENEELKKKIKNKPCTKSFFQKTPEKTVPKNGTKKGVTKMAIKCDQKKKSKISKIFWAI